MKIYHGQIMKMGVDGSGVHLPFIAGRDGAAACWVAFVICHAVVHCWLCFTARRCCFARFAYSSAPALPPLMLSSARSVTDSLPGSDQGNVVVGGEIENGLGQPWLPAVAHGGRCCWPCRHPAPITVREEDEDAAPICRPAPPRPVDRRWRRRPCRPLMELRSRWARHRFGRNCCQLTVVVAAPCVGDGAPYLGASVVYRARCTCSV
ncbi:hypothetical protein ACLOJK_009444 [Asimina triloba]